MLKWLSAGESHGPALVGILEGVPAGIQISSADISAQLARRRLGYGRGARMSFEQDVLRILGGVRHGYTLGGPIALEIANSEWPKWGVVMNPDPIDPADLLVDAGAGDKKEVARNRPLTSPRPGHADFAGMMKYGHTDARAVLERASARETAMRVAVGAVAQAVLQQVAGIDIVSQVLAIGEVSQAQGEALPVPANKAALDASPVRCLNESVAVEMMRQIDMAKTAGDTLGGVVEVIAYGVPIGLGSHVHWDRRLDAALAQAVMSIPAVKAVEIGQGMLQARSLGSLSHDEMYYTSSDSDERQVVRQTNLAGGIEGGMSNGNPVTVRAAIKPISTVPRALSTIDLATHQAASALHQRSDICAAVPGAVVAEAMVALVLAKELLHKTGGDSLDECSRNLQSYLQAIQERL